jgi:hypothetical protein
MCEAFRANGYHVVKSILRPAAARSLGARLAASVRQFGVESDIQVPGSPARYADHLGQELLVRLQPRIERVAGTRLFSTCSYARVYQHGAVLDRHTDRPACEISLSLNLSFEGDAPWPLWIEGPRGSAAITLTPGDGVLYRGIDCPHWRDAFQGWRRSSRASAGTTRLT